MCLLKNCFLKMFRTLQFYKVPAAQQEIKNNFELIVVHVRIIKIL